MVSRNTFQHITSWPAQRVQQAKAERYSAIREPTIDLLSLPPEIRTQIYTEVFKDTAVEIQRYPAKSFGFIRRAMYRFRIVTSDDDYTLRHLPHPLCYIFKDDTKEIVRLLYKHSIFAIDAIGKPQVSFPKALEAKIQNLTLVILNHQMPSIRVPRMNATQHAMLSDSQCITFSSLPNLRTLILEMRFCHHYEVYSPSLLRTLIQLLFLRKQFHLTLQLSFDHPGRCSGPARIVLTPSSTGYDIKHVNGSADLVARERDFLLKVLGEHTHCNVFAMLLAPDLKDVSTNETRILIGSDLQSVRGFIDQSMWPTFKKHWQKVNEQAAVSVQE